MSNRTEAKLLIDSLHDRHIGLTPAISETFCEAASVCLNRHHKSPVSMDVQSKNGSNARLVEFNKPDTRILNAWANDIDTTEAGAYGICLAAVEVEEDLVAVRRAETLTGADWYVSPTGSDPEDLENCLRLEVSGTDAGNETEVKYRLLKKVEQTKRGASNLPAIASVVGFKVKKIAIQKVSESE